MAKKEMLTPEQVIAALNETSGLVYLAADRLGCSAQTVYNYANRYPAVKDAMSHQKGKRLDTAEASLWKAVLAGEAWATCCVSGTLVTLADGITPLPIEDIRPGMSVLTHRGRGRPVQSVHRRDYQGTVRAIRVSGLSRALVVTPEHPVFARVCRGQQIAALDWVAAADLRVDDLVHLPRTAGESAYTYGPILSVEEATYNGPVYNLHVEEDESYVAELCSVHNCFYLKTQGKSRGYIERVSFGAGFTLHDLLNLLPPDLAAEVSRAYPQPPPGSHPEGPAGGAAGGGGSPAGTDPGGADPVPN